MGSLHTTGSSTEESCCIYDIGMDVIFK
jgi:hypothetical protein